ncbi:MAG: ParB N-terminal domain-containing protein, partial [Thauera sp.]|nr:ParB N-terminal domain-containing protein [Thauera sp.]
AVRDSLSVANPPDNSHQLSTEMEGLIQLKISEVVPYDRNPRRFENERYNDIKESIRLANVLAPIVVTRRPGEQQYMVAAGGNTRLKAQQELWTETGDSRFEYLLGIYRPWSSELATMVAHVAENELRGGLNFWDRANAVWALKAELEVQPGAKAPLSLRQLREELTSRGLPASVGLLSYYGFAVEELGKLETPLLCALTRGVVEAVQPEFNRLKKYLQLYGEDETWPKIRDQALKAYAALSVNAPGFEEDEVEGRRRYRALDPSHIISCIEQEILSFLDQTPAEMERISFALKQNPNLSCLQDVLMHLQAASAEAVSPPETESVTSDGASDSVAQAARGKTEADARKVPAQAPTTRPNPDQDHQRQPAESSVGVDGDDGSLLNQADAVAVAVADSGAKGHLLGDESDQEPAIIRFVRASGVADLFRDCPALPAGYFMEAPPADQTLEDFADPDVSTWRHGGWWIAAMLSGQIDGKYVELLPPDSLWRQLHELQQGEDELALQWHIETVLGSPPGLVELGRWLLECPLHVLNAYDDLMREQRLKRQRGQQ